MVASPLAKDLVMNIRPGELWLFRPESGPPRRVRVTDVSQGVVVFSDPVACRTRAEGLTEFLRRADRIRQTAMA